MSSSIEIEARVFVGAVFGAGWAAWKCGELAVKACIEINRQTEENKRQLAEAEKQRRIVAGSAHDKLVSMCDGLIAQLDRDTCSDGAAGLAKAEQLKSELYAIRNEPLPEDVAELESMTAFGYMKLDGIINQQRRLSALKLEEHGSGLYSGLSLADLMDDLRVVIGAMDIREVKGRNVAAADPDVLERKKLNEEFAQVTGRIVSALENIERMSKAYGLNPSAKAWFHSCFDGIDSRIERICSAPTTNERFKKNIRSLLKSVEQYESMAVSIENELARMSALYAVYADTARQLGEGVVPYKEFKDAREIEEMLRYLEQREKRASACAEIYQRMGQQAYMCFAWEQELEAMGYQPYKHSTVKKMVAGKPQWAELNGEKIPFYRWSDSELSRLYSAGGQCSLQVLVHEDGSVSMQTIAAEENEAVVEEQRQHCSQMELLRQRLWENWFISYDHKETEPPEKIFSEYQWRTSPQNPWSREDYIYDEQHAHREQEKEKSQMQ